MTRGQCESCKHLVPDKDRAGCRHGREVFVAFGTGIEPVEKPCEQFEEEE